MKKLSAALIAQAEAAFREAKVSDLRDHIRLVMSGLMAHLAMPEGSWLEAEAMYPDRIVVAKEGRYYAYPYEIAEDNTLTFGEPEEVVQDHQPTTERMTEALAADAVFIEAKAPGRYLVRVIRAGLSGNGVNYPREVLREAAPRFERARVFVKPDQEHIQGGGKDVSKLVGRLTNARFVEAGQGEIQAELDVFESHPIAAQLREAVERDMTDLFGLSIDAKGKCLRKGNFIEARSIDRVNSVDLIIEPGAGGQVLRFIEALQEDHDVKLRQQMISELKKRAPGRLEGLDQNDDDAVLTAYREAIRDGDIEQPAGTDAGSSADDLAAAVSTAVEQRMRMVEARAYARAEIAAAQLPQQAKDRLLEDFNAREAFDEAAVDAAIKREKQYLGSFREARIEGLGGNVEAGEDRADKVQSMLDDFFDPAKPTRSFREAYVDITGDRRVTGLLANCDTARLREAVGDADFREAISASTFANILGDSITRAMVRAYAQDERWQDWEFMVDVVPINDFRTQERVRLGGYGNLPAVSENGAYAALTSPDDEKSTYAISKRGGTETVSLETIANDDVGVIQRIPVALGTAAARTLYEFVLDFLDDNPTVYDSVALFHASHANLGTTALSAATWAAARLAMQKQAERDSSKRLGLLARHLVIPVDLEETAYDLFVRSDNIDETFVQSRKPSIHVVPYWTDANNWYALADKRDVPLVELGFYNGMREPELFVQDLPTQGSLFSNDQIKWKIRHIYGGAVIDYRGFYGAVVA